MNCGSCGEETGIMIDGEPFCVLCESQRPVKDFPNATVLVMPRRATILPLLLRAGALIVLAWVGLVLLCAILP